MLPYIILLESVAVMSKDIKGSDVMKQDGCRLRICLNGMGYDGIPVEEDTAEDTRRTMRKE